MGVLTLSIRRKTSTCTTLRSRPLTSPCSAASTNSASKPSGSTLTRIGQSSSAALSTLTRYIGRAAPRGVPRDTVTRTLAHEPFGHRPTTLLVRVRQYRCGHCRRTWRQDTTKAAAPRAKTSRGGIERALTAIVVDHLTVARAAAGLGVSLHTANSAILAEGKRQLIDDPTRFDGVTTIGVDEHVCRHTRSVTSTSP